MDDKENIKICEQKSPRVIAKIEDCTSIEQYKKCITVQKELQKVRRAEAIGRILQLRKLPKKEEKQKVEVPSNDDTNESIASAIKEEPQHSCDQIEYHDENVHDKNSNQSDCQKVKFVIETDGNIDKLTKDFLNSLGENSSNFNMKVKIGNFKFEVSNDS